MRGEPDADALAALTGPRRLTKAPAQDPVLGLTRPAPSAPQGGSGTASPAAIGGPSDPQEVPRPPKKEKLGGIYGYREDFDRLRAAWFHTQATVDGYPSFSDFLMEAARREASRLEMLYNSGHEWPAVPAGKVNRSRRVE